MEVLAILALLAALVASVLAILSLQRLAELNGLPREVERLAREGRFLRQRLRELEAEAGGGAEDVSLEEAAAPSRTEEFEVPSAGGSGRGPPLEGPRSPRWSSGRSPANGRCRRRW